MNAIFDNVLIVAGAIALGCSFLYAIVRYRCWTEGQEWQYCAPQKNHRPTLAQNTTQFYLGLTNRFPIWYRYVNTILEWIWMAENKRDYAREAVAAKARGETLLGVKVNKALKEEFAAKCARNGTTMNAVLKAYIERYLCGDEN